MHIYGITMLGSRINQVEPVGLPPLVDSLAGSLSRVTCFSDQTTEDKSHISGLKDECNLTMLGSSSTDLIPNIGSMLYSDPVFMQDNSSILKMMLLGSEETQFKKDIQGFHTAENELTTSSWHGHGLAGSTGSVEVDCYWDF
ncbi:hypothetical protein Bca52824_068345 [Brassica carinata]|nr:hypothetical protein Bca52824_068345 [Brassica carinata]